MWACTRTSRTQNHRNRGISNRSDTLSARWPFGRHLERLAKIIHESFDFRAMARESLGSHWASLTPEQRDRFVGLFAQLFERSYDRLVLRFLGGSTTTYGTESVDAERAVVKTALHRKGGDELPVDYRLTADGGVWKISDVVVDAVSLCGNFRAQLAKPIRAPSDDGLVQ